MPFFRLSLAVALLLSGASANAATPAASALPPLDATTVLLVVAPHPDDETLCCAGAIQRVLHAGGRVSIVWLTSGDGSPLGYLVIEHSLLADPVRMRAYGRQRMTEARAATARLGVTPAGQLFLGYPDGGLPAAHPVPPAPLRFTLHGAAAVPYSARSSRSILTPARLWSATSRRDPPCAAVDTRAQPARQPPGPPRRGTAHDGFGTAARRRAGALLDRARWEGWPTPRGLLRVPMTRRRWGRAGSHGIRSACRGRYQARRGAATQQLRVMAPFLLRSCVPRLFATRAGGDAERA
jgi:hypothetical protein